ncbi:MAG: adenylosuccinate synthetase [Oscillochloris sp.]|nr:adenylosuccinate synthetase [Oscillochloris sp.]
MRQAFLTVDLGFGDAGKGTIVDYLTRAYAAHTIVRFNGGAQAGHRVVLADGREHVFAQFGSGTFAGAATHLSQFMLVDPPAMLAEAAHLESLGILDPFAQTTIDERALIITPYARAVNRLRELARGADRHGSCGMGIGETMADALALGDRALRAGDLRDPQRLQAKLTELRLWNRRKLLDLALPDTPAVVDELAPLLDDDWQNWIRDKYAELTARVRIVPAGALGEILAQPGHVIFEAAQGVLLDEWRGFHPYTTWSTTTLANAEQLLAEAGYDGAVRRIGITRAYSTRHGAGPLPSEDPALTAALPDARNGMHAWQQGFRVGWLDLVLLRYARRVVGALDELAVTCVDRLADVPELRVCGAYRSAAGGLVEWLEHNHDPHDLGAQEQITRMLLEVQPVLENLADRDALLGRIAAELDLPVGIVSYGPTAADKRQV